MKEKKRSKRENNGHVRKDVIVFGDEWSGVVSEYSRVIFDYIDSC